VNYTVVWEKKAQDKLAQEWLDANSPWRADITAAAQKIEAALKASPEEAGESRLPDRRIMIEYPLVVLFKVLCDDRLVQVLDVRVRKAKS